MLPEKTLAARHEKGAKGMKKQKERVTLMACANASGSHKLPLTFIHKYQKPHCFKHVNVNALPVKYYAQRNAWMNVEIFIKWFETEFVPEVRKHLKNRGLEPKAILLLDNAPSHPDEGRLISDDKKITAMFLPANTTSLIQPMDQGVLKRRYRKSLLRKLLMADDENQSMIAFVKSLNIKDVIYMIGNAWEDVPSTTVCKSWFKLLHGDDSVPDETEPSSIDKSSEESCEDILHQLDDSLTSEDISNWMSVDQDDPGYQYATDEEIVQQVLGSALEDSDDENEMTATCIPDPTMSDTEAAMIFEQCFRWYEQQKEATPTSLMVLKGLRDLASKKRCSNLKQNTLRSYMEQQQSI